MRARLESEGYRVVVAVRRRQAIALHREHHPDLVVLDLMLPGMDGLEVCKEIQRDGWTPVLMLTAKTEEADKVAGFAVGADDYLTKPFSLRELAARVKAILRRDGAHARRGTDGPLERGGLKIDPRAATRRRRRRGDRAHAARVRDPVRAWPATRRGAEPRAADGQRLGLPRLRGRPRSWTRTSRRIRRKLGEDGNEPRFIRTVHGVGYAFQERRDTRPLERLPTIRAKLGFTIVFAVGMTVILIFLMLGYALRRLVAGHGPTHALRVARRSDASPQRLPPAFSRRVESARLTFGSTITTRDHSVLELGPGSVPTSAPMPSVKSGSGAPPSGR